VEEVEAEHLRVYEIDVLRSSGVGHGFPSRVVFLYGPVGRSSAQGLPRVDTQVFHDPESRGASSAAHPGSGMGARTAI